MNTTYPQHHQDIVTDLLAGKFILQTQKSLFKDIQENIPFYTAFFQASHGYKLETDHPYFFLSSQDTQEETSRDMILCLALLAYEYHNEQRDFVKEVLEGVFHVQGTDQMLKASSQYDALLKGTQAEDFERFVNAWHNRNLLTFTDLNKKSFRFNAPIHTFLEPANALYEQYLQEGK